MNAEVEPGYKRTEVSVIPIDWDTKRLGEIALLERGKFSARPRNDPKYFGGQTPFIQTGDVTNSCGLVTDYSQTLNEAGLAVSKVFKKGTIFFTIAANIGDVAFAVFDAACPDSLIGITPKLSSINRIWLFHELKSRKRDFETLATQNAQLNINLEKLNPYQLPIPPFKEQEAIASALSDMDALISSLGLLIAKKRDIQKAAMQQILTCQRRLPGFSREWEVRRLGDHLSFLRNGTNSRAELLTEGDVRYLHYGDIHGSQNLLLSPTKIPMPCLPPEKAKRLDCLEDGDLIFADASEDLEGVGKSVEVQGLEGVRVVAGLHTIALRFDKKILADGFKAYLQFIPEFRAHLRQLAAGTKVYATNRSHIASAEIKMPEIEEQTAIAAVLSDMDDELAELEARRDKSNQLKQGMMQELLSGRIRLS